MLTTKTSAIDPLLHPVPGRWSPGDTNHQPTNQLQPDSAIHTPRVFVIDDDAEVRESLELLLLAEALLVETYESADAFWEVFHPDRRGCVILDLRMPGMNGVDLLERMAEHDHGLSLLVVSASSDPDEKLRAKQLGAIECFSKPYDTNALLATIRERLTCKEESVRSIGK